MAVEQFHHRRPLQLDADRAADISPVRHRRLDDDRQRNRRDRERDALHAQGQQADREAEQGVDGAGGAALNRQRRPSGFEQKHRRVDAHAEKRAGAEIDVAGIAAENAPCHREHDELQDYIAGEERIFVAYNPRHQQGGGEKQRPRDPECDAVTPPDRLPSKPCGRMARTASSIAKEIADAQEAPTVLSTIDSTTPRMMAAISVPVMLPSPAMTTTQKVRPM